MSPASRITVEIRGLLAADRPGLAGHGPDGRRWALLNAVATVVLVVDAAALGWPLAKRS